MPAATGFALFGTAIGECALAWGDAGIRGVWLPQPEPAALRARVVRRRQAREGPVPPSLAGVVEALQALLRGESADLGAAPLDLFACSEFEQRVYALARTIPAGRVSTYGEISRRLGTGEGARAVGRALGDNPWPLIVPCHRVVAVNGELGGFSAPGGVELKRRLLAIEGARFGDEADLFDRAAS